MHETKLARSCGEIAKPWLLLLYPRSAALFDILNRKQLLAYKRIALSVVPAKAGTHNHRPLLACKAGCHRAKTRGRGVWVPARASLGRDDGRREFARLDPLAWPGRRWESVALPLAWLGRRPIHILFIVILRKRFKLSVHDRLA
jgi:hypothetical protein